MSCVHRDGLAEIKRRARKLGREARLCREQPWEKQRLRDELLDLMRPATRRFGDTGRAIVDREFRVGAGLPKARATNEAAP